ncbi:MAG: 5-formyltetrahydrofolate cyclo-ligase [Flavonifractor plautii]
MPSTTTAEKAELRRRARQYLRELSPQVRRASDDALFARFLALPQVEAADTLLLYHGMGGEPDTARLLPALWARGKAVCLPRCLPGHGLEARLVRPDSALIPHPYGMLEPGEDCPLVGKDAIGLVLVPGLAFDPSGGRLGQGGGFYDRWLADYAGCTAALCRTALLLPQVPRAPHDRGGAGAHRARFVLAAERAAQALLLAGRYVNGSAAAVVAPAVVVAAAVAAAATAAPAAAAAAAKDDDNQDDPQAAAAVAAAPTIVTTAHS